MKISKQKSKEIIKEINFTKFNGLIPVVIQDFLDNKVLMVAFANEKAVFESLTTGYAHFYSRSRNKIWKKGETSGHYQIIKEVYTDCDNDSIIFLVEQQVAACHTGYKTCFYKKLNENGNWIIKEKKVFETDQVYKK